MPNQTQPVGLSPRPAQRGESHEHVIEQFARREIGRAEYEARAVRRVREQRRAAHNLDVLLEATEH